MISKKNVRLFLRNYFGIDLVRYTVSSHPLARRARLLETYGIDLVIDIGANSGSFGQQLRSIGYSGRILSFEPLLSAYRTLTDVARTDKHWTALNVALGKEIGAATINISRNSYSSSMNEMLPSHLAAAPYSEYVGTQTIDVITLDSYFEKNPIGQENLLLKIDTQGSEMSVLEGAKESLDEIRSIQLEMSLVSLYENDVMFAEMHKYLVDCGYELVGIEPGFTDTKTGRLLQVDGIFHKA